MYTEYFSHQTAQWGETIEVLSPHFFQVQAKGGVLD